jgi:hypothetical protein
MLYPLLHRLERFGYLRSSWGLSEAGRRRMQTPSPTPAAPPWPSGRDRVSGMQWPRRCGRHGTAPSSRPPGKKGGHDGAARWAGGPGREVARACCPAEPSPTRTWMSLGATCASKSPNGGLDRRARAESAASGTSGPGSMAFGRIHPRQAFWDLERWQTHYLPIYGAWAAVMVMAFPPVLAFA